MSLRAGVRPRRKFKILDLGPLTTSTGSSRSASTSVSKNKVHLRALHSESWDGTLHEDRVKADQALKRIELILNDREEYRRLLDQQGTLAQSLLDLLQSLCDHPSVDKKLRSKISSAMIRLSKRSGLFPKCLALHDVEKYGNYPVAVGGFGEIWKGAYAGQSVCIKVLKTYSESEITPRLVKAFLREAILWRQLDHPNVLPFLGLRLLDSAQRISLVSPWMKNGNLHEYLGGDLHGSINRTILAYDVACGLAYLHENKVIHGDLKGVNILITSSGRATIADFGLSRLVVAEALTLTATGSHIIEGTARWLAPECLMEAQPLSYESDIYAFGCVCYELFTGKLPFHQHAHDVSVIFELMKGCHPYRPPRDDCPQLSDEIWMIMQECWVQNPFGRPQATVLAERFACVNSVNIELADDWKSLLAPPSYHGTWHPEWCLVGPRVKDFLNLSESVQSSSCDGSVYPTTTKHDGFNAKVLFDFRAEYPNELDAKKGDSFTVFAHSTREWGVGKIGQSDRLGLVPLSYVDILSPLTGQAVSDVGSLISEGELPEVGEWLQTAASKLYHKKVKDADPYANRNSVLVPIYLSGN